MPIIRFQTNIPQEVHLRSLDGKPVESQFGGIQYMFSADEGAFYVSDKVGGILMDQFRKLGVKPGDAIEVIKAETGNGVGRRTQWMVTVAGGQLTDTKRTIDGQLTDNSPSELEQKLAESIAAVEARKTMQKAPAATQQPAWAAHLVAQTKQLIDVYADAVSYASQRHGNAVKPEDVRSLMLSCFINVSKNGGNANAA